MSTLPDVSSRDFKPPFFPSFLRPHVHSHSCDGFAMAPYMTGWGRKTRKLTSDFQRKRGDKAGNILRWVYPWGSMKTNGINWFQAFLEGVEADWWCFIGFVASNFLSYYPCSIWYLVQVFELRCWRVVQVSINSKPVRWQHELKASIPQMYPNPKSFFTPLVNSASWMLTCEKSWNRMNLAIHPLVHQKDNANPACLGGHTSSWWIYVDLSSTYSAPFIPSQQDFSRMAIQKICWQKSNWV